jgi:hypothetical protein
MLTDDGADPSVKRNVPRFGKIDGTIYSDQISMSGVRRPQTTGAGEVKFLQM